MPSRAGHGVAVLLNIYGHGAEVSKHAITAITGRVMDGMAEWQSRPLDPVYAVVFIDPIHVKIREGQVASRPVYLALGVTVDGTRASGACGPGSTWLVATPPATRRSWFYGMRSQCCVVRSAAAAGLG